MFESAYWNERFTTLVKKDEIYIGLFIDGSSVTSGQFSLVCFHYYNLVEHAQEMEMSIIGVLVDVGETSDPFKKALAYFYEKVKEIEDEILYVQYISPFDGKPYTCECKIKYVSLCFLSQY
jgi:hypothetical protein